MRIAISVLMAMTVAFAGADGLAQAPPPPPSPDSPDGRPDVAGFRDGFFLRDRGDVFRFYPRLFLATDFHSSFGPGTHPDAATTSAQAPDVADGLKARIFLSRIRLGFDAELFNHWSASAQIDFGGQQIANTTGTAETSAQVPNAAPTATSGRYAPVQTAASAPVPADVFINYSLCKCLNLEIGQMAVPFSLENRTPDEYYPMLERPVAIRNFVVPSERDIGLMAWGELGPRVFDYELGIFGGDGQNRPFVGGRVDGIGRIYARPFAGHGGSDLEKYTQIGVSARYGWRDQASVAYDAPAITTGQGFVLWKPTYTDSLGRLVHVIPSGAQGWIGGELRFQVDRFSLQGEAYYVANDTREAIDGFQLTHTERLGRMLGVGWYAELSAWPFGRPFLGAEPGMSQPHHLDLSSRRPFRVDQGLEMTAVFSGIDASYKGATRRGSTPDPNTPMSDVTVYQVGVGANYWTTKHARVGLYYMAYVTPNGGTSSNEAVVPDNLTTDKATGRINGGIVLHELSGRVAIAF